MRYFPELKETKDLVVCSTDGISSWETATLRALQGVVNRKSVRLWIAGNPAHDLWLDYYRERFGYSIEKLTPSETIARFREDVEGFVRIDPNLGATFNIALILSADRNVIPIRTEGETLLAGSEIPVVEDLSGRWKDSITAYRWALENKMPQCSKKIVCHSRFRFQHEMNQGRTKKPVPEDGFTHNPDVDLVVAARAFCFDIGHLKEVPFPGRSKEAELVHDIFNALDQPAMCIGWMYWMDDPPLENSTRKNLLSWEDAYVRTISQHGHFAICGGGGNMSVHTAVTPTIPLKQSVPPEIELDSNGVYACFGISDGDALWCITSRFEGMYDTSRQSRSVPLGWTLNPMFIEMAPGIYQYYLENATENDLFVAACAGAAYFHPHHVPNLTDFIQHNAYYCNTADIHVLMGMIDDVEGADRYGDYGNLITDKVPSFLSDTTFIGAQEGYGPRYALDLSWDEQNFFYQNKPWLSVMGEKPFSWFETFSPDKLANTAKAIMTKESKRPLFLNFFLGIPHGARYEHLAQINTYFRKLGIKILRPDTFMLKITEAKQKGLVSGIDL